MKPTLVFSLILFASPCVAQDYINGTSQFLPQEFAIASLLDEYRNKIKSVAEEHPEFLNAIIEYGTIQERYRDATRTGE